MLKSTVQALCLAMGLVFSGMACAISMGDIEVANSMGEPLNASIGLVATPEDEIGTFSARLASPEVFKDAGLEYPAKLPPLSFRIETNAKGEPYIRITSEQPVNESFVDLLVELSWPSGRLLREYIFLLDPPGQGSADLQSEEVKPFTPVTVDMPGSDFKESTRASNPERHASNLTAEETDGETPFDSPGQGSADIQSDGAKPFALITADKPGSDDIHSTETDDSGRLAPGWVAEETEDEKLSVREPDEGKDMVYGSIQVNRGDTLIKLAQKTKPAGVSLERALVALYRANADAFRGNMNRLKTGKVLYMPVQSDLDGLSQAEAVKEFRSQTKDWHAYRQRLAAASAIPAGEQASGEASGRIGTSVTDDVSQSREIGKDVVRLSRGEVPGDQTSSGNHSESMQSKMNAVEEETIARNKAINESNQRVAALEKNIEDLQRLADLRGQSPATSGESSQSLGGSSAESKPDEAQTGTMQEVPVSAPDAAAVTAVGGASLDEPAEPAHEPQTAVKQRSFLDVILGDPLYMAGGAAALFGLAGLGYILTRRDKEEVAVIKTGRKADHQVDPFGQMVQPVSAAPDIAVSPGGGVAQQSSGLGKDEVGEFDPISGADLLLSFGHEDQAETILKEGLSKNPGNPRIYLKLLSLYANRQDALSFNSIARQLKELGDASAWEQATVMGIQLEPDNPMYADKAGEVAKESPGSDLPADVPPKV